MAAISESRGLPDKQIDESGAVNTVHFQKVFFRDVFVRFVDGSFGSFKLGTESTAAFEYGRESRARAGLRLFVFAGYVVVCCKKTLNKVAVFVYIKRISAFDRTVGNTRFIEQR